MSSGSVEEEAQEDGRHEGTAIPRVPSGGAEGTRECLVSIEPYLGCGLSGLRRLEKFTALEIEHTGDE